jgi:NADPH-dependent glutamate synthase beta subunit-like oxidoreductase
MDKRYGLVFDLNRCVGCLSCWISCKAEHSLEKGSGIRMVTVGGPHLDTPAGMYPNLTMYYQPTPCMHCAEPPCLDVCPVGAISKREDGIVLVDQDKCREDGLCGGIIAGYEPPLALSMGEREAPCQVTCPAHLKIPAYISLIAKGKTTEALDLIRRNMPLPSVCGRICNHPCEAQCARNKLDEPLAIASLRRYVADNADWETPQPLPRTKAQKVAIVGSGPAGLSAAYDLVRMGYGVTIFEALPVAGGMLAVGIPEYRLPRDVLQRDINYIVGLGVEIRTSTPLGPELTLDDLAQRGYSATFIATGAHKGVKLNIPGIELKDVISGVSFLKDVKLGQKVRVGKKVLVIGGGNVAIDAARTALRLGAKKVHMNCLETREEMPALPEEIEGALDEGITLSCSSGPKRILSDNGKVTGVEFIKCTSVFDEQGKFCPMYDEDSVTSINADTVILAIGQKPDNPGQFGLRGGNGLEVDPTTLMTSKKGVFAGGDVIRVATAIDAIAAGQTVAKYIDRYLTKGITLKERGKTTPVKASDIKIEIPATIEKAPRQKMPLLPAGERIKGFAEVALGFDQKMAESEAERCLNCAGSLCRDACPYNVPAFDQETDKLQKCNMCAHRIDEGLEPFCVTCSVYDCICFGDLNDPESKASKRISERGAYTIKPEAGTGPAVYYCPEVRRQF